MFALWRALQKTAYGVSKTFKTFVQSTKATERISSMQREGFQPTSARGRETCWPIKGTGTSSNNIPSHLMTLRNTLVSYPQAARPQSTCTYWNWVLALPFWAHVTWASAQPQTSSHTHYWGHTFHITLSTHTHTHTQTKQTGYLVCINFAVLHRTTFNLAGDLMDIGKNMHGHPAPQKSRFLVLLHCTGPDSNKNYC